MPHRRGKSHGLRNALIVAVVLMLILGIVVAAYRMNGGGPANASPTYSDVSSSSTVAGSTCTFSTLWADDANVSGYIFETNNTGAFVNDTWTPFSTFVGPTSSDATITKTLDNTIGDVVQWRFWCNDTNDNWNAVSTQSFFVDTDKVLLVTSMGNITIEVYDDMPITTGNFKNLVSTGVYDGTLFSRVAYNFVIQGGDATPEGITVPPIQDELPNKHSNVRGAVAMAKTDQNNSATSQFFIDLNDTNAAILDSNYSVFGRVISGMDIVDAIGHVPITATNPTQDPNDGTPNQDIIIISAQFIR